MTEKEHLSIIIAYSKFRTYILGYTTKMLIKPWQANKMYIRSARVI